MAIEILEGPLLCIQCGARTVHHVAPGKLARCADCGHLRPRLE